MGVHPGTSLEPPTAPAAWDGLASTANLSSPVIWQCLLTEPDGQGGQRPVAVGYYIPEQVEQVSFADLDPAERSAVRRLLRDEATLVAGPEI